MSQMPDGWERVTAQNVTTHLDVIREQMGRVAKDYGQPMDPQHVTVTELMQILSPDHVCMLLWDNGFCCGIVTGDMAVGPCGEPLLRIQWIDIIQMRQHDLHACDRNPTNRSLLNELMDWLQVKAVIIESPRARGVIHRWDSGFKEVSVVYRKDLDPPMAAVA